jgi:hypothetical protein
MKTCGFDDEQVAVDFIQKRFGTTADQQALEIAAGHRANDDQGNILLVD